MYPPPSSRRATALAGSTPASANTEGSVARPTTDDAVPIGEADWSLTLTADGTMPRYVRPSNMTWSGLSTMTPRRPHPTTATSTSGIAMRNITGAGSPRQPSSRCWSGRWDSNPQPRAPKARAPPLRHAPTGLCSRSASPDHQAHVLRLRVPCQCSAVLRRPEPPALRGAHASPSAHAFSGAGRRHPIWGTAGTSRVGLRPQCPSFFYVRSISDLLSSGHRSSVGRSTAS